MMSRLHSHKIRQIGGIIAAAIFLLLAANVYSEDTGEKGLAVVICGAVVAFLFGYGLSPSLRERLFPKKRR
jgi:hypothetical protein